MAAAAVVDRKRRRVSFLWSMLQSSLVFPRERRRLFCGRKGLVAAGSASRSYLGEA